MQSLFGNNSDEEIHPEEFNHPGVLMENKERAAELFKALQQLPDKQRIAFYAAPAGSTTAPGYCGDNGAFGNSSRIINCKGKRKFKADFKRLLRKNVA